MKRKNKRQLVGVLNTVKNIIFGGVLLVGLSVVSELINYGSLEIKSIYNTLTFNTIKKSDTLYVVSDNTVNISDLLKTKQIIETYFGLNVKISNEKIVFDSDLFDNEGYLQGCKTLRRYDDENDKIIITKLNCKNGNKNIAGVSQGAFGNILLVSNSSTFNSSRLFEETIIHELSHNFGLDHCDDYNCIMYHIGSHLGKHDMCDDCRKKLLEKLD